jgi:HK97 family phage major capsid protein
MNKSLMQKELKAAKAIADRAQAAGRDLSPDEVTTISGHLSAYEAAKTATDELPGFKSFGGNIHDLNSLLGVHGAGNGRPNQTKSYQAAAAFRWGEKALAAVRDRADRLGTSDGAKALTSGSIDVPSVLGEPVEIAGRPTSLLQLIPTKGAAAGEGNIGNAFSYLRQSTRTNNAAAVADNATKPTSVYTFADVEDTYRVYAHLSEVFPKRYLDDYGDILEILQNQMGAGLLEALERDVLSGAAQPATEFTGVLNTSGIQAQAFSTDLLTTLTAARYKLVTAFQTPSAWVLNPLDVRSLELLREDGATGALMFRKGLSDIEEFLGGFPIVMSNLMTQGTGLVGDWTQTELLVREDDHLDVDTSGDKFSKNQVQFRLEGRYGFTVRRPTAFVSIDLTE